MNVNNQQLTANFAVQTDNTHQIDKTASNCIAKFYNGIVIVIFLLLMAGNAVSAVIDDIKADMQLNEAPLLNAPVGPGWAKGATIEMGGAPRGDATPYWWKPYNTSYKNPTPWSTIAPWFVIYPGTYNAAKNVRVKVYGLKLYVWNKSTHQWIKIDTGSGKPLWAGNYGFGLTRYVSNAPARVEPDGQLSYKLDASSHPLHGGLPQIDLTKFIANPLDIGTVIVYIKSQLILDNASGIDDRASAQLLFNVGADYYPTMASKMTDFAPMGYVPSVGSSRFGLVKTAPRTHYMATIDPPGTFDTISTYVRRGGSIAMYDYDLAANLPPDLADTTPPSQPTALSYSLSKSTSTAKVVLSWTSSTDNVKVGGYNIYRNGTKIGVSATPTYTNYLGAATGALYSYSVKAFDDVGNLSARSNTVYVVY